MNSLGRFRVTEDAGPQRDTVKRLIIMLRIFKAVAVLGLGLAVFGTSSQKAAAAFSLQSCEMRALRKGEPDGPKKPPRPKRLPFVDELVSPIASVDIG